MQLHGISIVVKVDKLLVKENVLASACLRYLKNWRTEGKYRTMELDKGRCLNPENIVSMILRNFHLMQRAENNWGQA